MLFLPLQYHRHRLLQLFRVRSELWIWKQVAHLTPRPHRLRPPPRPPRRPANE